MGANAQNEDRHDSKGYRQMRQARLLNYYEQCNRDRIETEKKRDQLMAFYTAVVGAFLAYISKNGGNGAVPIQALTLIMSLLGMLLTVNLVVFRRWHFQYLNTAQLLQDLIEHPSHPPEDVADERKAKLLEYYGIREDCGPFSCKWLKVYFRGIEFWTFVAFQVVAFLPLYAAILEFGLGFPYDGLWKEAVPVLVDFALYLILVNLLSLSYLYCRLRAKPWAHWLLAFLSK